MRRFVLAALASTALASAAPVPAAAAPLSDCFWLGPISTKQRARTVDRFDGRNFNFPEESATYWLARFNVPTGATLRFRGRFAHARYESLNSYVAGGIPADALADVRIDPAPGATNPFRPGARRDRPRRDWAVALAAGPPPATGRATNTLYAGDTQGRPVEVVLRVYEPDRGRDLTGGVGLPRPELRLADRRTVTGRAACAALNDADRTLDATVQRIPPSLWQTLVNTPGGDPATSPAFNPPQWERFFNQTFAAGVFAQAAGRPRPLENMVDVGGFYSNGDTRYVITHLSRRFGEVLVIRGRMPTFPRTREGVRRMGTGQVRFWSLCSGESRVTTRTPDCLADRQVPLGRNRRYTIVVSRAADRPRNARRRCGVAWLDWGTRGDAAGRPDYGLLIMRNMLASPSFAQAIQRIERFGDERRVMGPYFPVSRYTSSAAFERRGC
jgi:hypothetical protein